MLLQTLYKCSQNSCIQKLILLLIALATVGMIIVYNIQIEHFIVNLSIVYKNKSYFYAEKCSVINTTKNQFRVIIDGVSYPNIVPLYHNISINFSCLNSSKSNKKILMWTKFKGEPLVDYGFGPVRPFEKMNCPVTNCELTEDRKKLKVADLVLFHLRNKIDYFPSNLKKFLQH